jgi:hypothetical protein
LSLIDVGRVAREKLIVKGKSPIEHHFLWTNHAEMSRQRDSTMVHWRYHT